jgi:hypothetical protein
MSKTKNSTNMAHDAIKRTERFERVSPGEYRLKTPANGGNAMLKAEQLASGAPLVMFTQRPPLQ